MSSKPFDYAKTPFPWFGGKTEAAPLVWAALGDPANYVEPFFGGGAVLLRRPHPANRAYVSETVNDLDGLLVNFWRAVQLSPAATAEAASWPVSELDKHARGCAILKHDALDIDRLAGDPTYHDPVIAGWWAWSVCVAIGGFGVGGPWWPDADGRLVKHPDTMWYDPDDDDAREPGVSRELPRLSDGGVGVNHSGLREPGVFRNRPHLGGNGRGVNHAGLRQPGVTANHGYHPITMPQLETWFAYLSARLRHTRIITGDYKRALGNGALKTLSVRGKDGTYTGVFLDPPYAAADRAGLYRHDSYTVATEAAQWAVQHGHQPWLRIVAAGYTDDPAHEIYKNAGWTTIDWYQDGWLKGGYGNGSATGNQQHREQLYLSPHCTNPNNQTHTQDTLTL